jgi:hypothetical protein
VAANDLLPQRIVAKTIGAARLLRLVRAGWLAPVTPVNGRRCKTSPVLFAAKDVRGVIRRLERGETTAPDKIEVARVRVSEIRHGRAYVPITATASDLSDLNLDELV